MPARNVRSGPYLEQGPLQPIGRLFESTENNRAQRLRKALCLANSNSLPFSCEDIMMRRHTSLVFLCIFLFAEAGTVFGQAGCEFDITGDWEAIVPGHAGPDLYRFTADGMVTILSAVAKGEERQKMGRAKYRLEDAPNARTLEFKP